jgi:hypothetical protein
MANSGAPNLILVCSMLFDTVLIFFPLLWGCYFGFGSVCFGSRA